MAEVVLRHLIGESDLLRGQVEVTSAGTANWHVGSAMDPRARDALERAGFTSEGSIGAYASTEFLDRQDYVVVMTREHLIDVANRRRRSDGTVILIRSLLDPQHELDLADPYYGNEEEFDACLMTIIRSCRELVPR